MISNPFGGSANSNSIKKKLLLLFLVLISATKVSAQWQIIYQDSANFRFKAVYFINNDTGFVGGWNLTSGINGIIYRTQDGGQTWNTTPVSEIIYDIHFVNDSVGFAGGDAGAVFATSDGGNLWVYKGGIGAGSDITSLYFYDSLNGFRLKVVGEIQKTNDGGVTWQTIFQSQGGAYYPGNSRFRFPLGNIGYLTAGGYYQTFPVTPSIAKTLDSGNIWIDLNIPSNFFPYSSFFFDSISGIAVGRVGMISSTMDGGINWTSPVSIGNYSLYDIYFVTDSIGYIVGGSNIYDNPPNPFKGIIYKTVDKGSSWQVMDSSIFNGLNKLSFPNDSIGYAVGMNGNILKIINANNIYSSVQSISNLDYEFSVYPNPTITTLFVKLKKAEKIILINMFGEIIMERIVSLKKMEIEIFDISELSPGIYFIKTGSEVRKFMKE